MRDTNIKQKFLLAWALVFSPYFILGLFDTKAGMYLLILGIVGAINIALSSPEGFRRSWMEGPFMLGLLFVYNLIFSFFLFTELNVAPSDAVELTIASTPVMFPIYLLAGLYTLRFLWQVLKNSESTVILKIYAVAVLIAAFLSLIIETIGKVISRTSSEGETTFFRIINELIFPLTYIKQQAFSIASMFGIHFELSPVEHLATSLLSAVMVGSLLFVILYIILLPFRKMHFD